MHKDVVDESSYNEQTPATASTEQPHDVAVIDLACGLPGDNNSLEELWDFQASKSDACSETTPARWEAYRCRDGANARILDNVTTLGYFVDGMENFDAAFFGISPKEAEQLDPQEALEHAGIPPQSLAGSDTAVFMGVNTGD